MSGAVILAKLNTLNEAHIVAGILKQNGIPAAVGEAGYASIDWFSIPALGGVSVLVPQVALEDAYQIIVETAELGPPSLEAQFGSYQAPKRYGRAAVWYFWLSQFYLIQAIIIIALFAAHHTIPKEWIPQSGFTVSSYYGTGGTIDLEEIADGLLLFFFILLFFVAEAVSLRKSELKDPTR